MPAKNELIKIVLDLHSHIKFGKKKLALSQSEPIQNKEEKYINKNSNENQFKQEKTVQKQITLNSNDENSFNELREKVNKCIKCRLFKTRKKVVFGSGTPHTKIMIIGEAPGRDEDLQGAPFVGKAGQLLTKMLEAIDIKREDVFICNILKCRPPNNRNPLTDEIETCTPYLNQQIQLISPEIIVTLGKFASTYILQSEVGIMKLRGKSYEKDGRTIVPIFHPSALLRNDSLKRPTWEDLKMLKEILIKKGIFI